MYANVDDIINVDIFYKARLLIEAKRLIAFGGLKR